MNSAETLRVALAGIAANRLRSALTILGMTIGVAAVIVLVAVGNGSKEAVQSQIQALGTNVLTVSSATRGFGPGGQSSGASDSLSIDDVRALEDREVAPDILRVAPVITASSVSFVSGQTSYSPSSTIGTTPAYLPASSYEIEDGESFTTQDVTDKAAVVVIGPTVAQELGASVGSTVQAGGRTFSVVGITTSKGTSGSDNADDIVLMPYTTAQDAVAGYGALDQIKVQATSEEALDLAQAEVEEILNLRHPPSDSSSSSSALPAGFPGFPGAASSSSSSSSSFQILNQASLLETSSATTSVFTALLGAVAAISLLVGGIGVMNIMLVSVTERTREIGIRKAIGARRSDILGQFLTEAVLVSALGGLLGVAVGLLVSTFQIAGVEPAVAAGSVVLAFGASVLCGLFFGTYPAARAARLRPIEALRFE